MKSLPTLLLLAFAGLAATAQDNVFDLVGLEPNEDYENIFSMELETNANSTNFLIWVKDEVAAHYHESHTETLYVLSGSAIMQLGDDAVRIGPGSLVIIPPKTIHSAEVTSNEPLKVLSVQAPEFHPVDRHFIDGK